MRTPTKNRKRKRNIANCTNTVFYENQHQLKGKSYTYQDLFLFVLKRKVNNIIYSKDSEMSKIRLSFGISFKKM